MSDLATMARPALDDLLKQPDETKLYAELTNRVYAIRANPSLGGSFAPEYPHVEDYGAKEDLEAFGKRFFDRLSAQAYELMCGSDAENTQERKKLVDAFGIGKQAVAPALAALLVTYLGLAPAIAAVVAAIAITLFFQSAYGAMCDIWKTKLPKGTS